MTIVSDTSPLSALASIGQLDLLRKLFERITIPQEVLHECLHVRSPGLLGEWARSLPEWVFVAEATGKVPVELAHLDPGETAALMIAMTYRPSVLLLIDERKGTKSAEAFGIAFVGTLGLLVKGHLDGHLDFETALDELRNTTFHIGESAILFARKMITKQ